MLILYVVVRVLLGLYYSNILTGYAKSIQGYSELRYVHIVYFLMSFMCTASLWFLFVDLEDPYKIVLISFSLCVYPIVRLSTITNKIEIGSILLYAVVSSIADLYLYYLYATSTSWTDLSSWVYFSL